MAWQPRSRVHIYNRVSSTAQKDGYSLDDQESACRSWAVERGLPVASVEREVWSGADRDRPKLNAILDRLREGDTFLVYNQDRFSRGGAVDTFVLIDRIEATGAVFQFATGDFDRSEWGPLKQTVDAILAEREREDIRRRTQGGRRARVASGKPIPGGKPPYGYRWLDPDKPKGGKTRLVPDPETAPVVRLIFELALAGESLRAIAASLDARHILTPYGKSSWTAATVRRVLTRQMYSTGAATAYTVHYERRPNGKKGYRQRDTAEEERVQIPDVAPPLVGREDQAAVMARLATNQSFATRNNSNPEATLLRAGFVRCGHCGWAMRVNSASARNGARYCCHTYRKGRCANPVITATPLDTAVWALVAAILRDPAIIAAEVERQRDDGALERDLAAVEKMLAAITEKQAITARAITAVDDDEAAGPLIAELKALGERKKAAQRDRDSLPSVSWTQRRTVHRCGPWRTGARRWRPTSTT